MNSNDIDDSKPDTPTATPDATTEAPARPKRTRKTAAASAEATTEVTAESTAEATPKPRARRKPAAAAAEAADTAETSAPAAATVEPSGDADAPAKPKRRTRAKAADADATTEAATSAPMPEVETSPVATIAPAPAPVSAVSEVVQAVIAGDADESSGEAASESDADGRSGRNRRRRGRDGREPREARDPAQAASRGPRGPSEKGEQGGAVDASAAQGGSAPKANTAELQARAQERFDELLSGAFDDEDDMSVEAADVDLDLGDELDATDAGDDDTAAGAEGAGKRVLAPEPDAPKLQKVLAQAGVGSRRDIEDMIAKGQITVNGEVAHVGQRISYGDRIAVAGKPIKVRIAPIAPRILAYHKPVGEVVTFNDPEGRPTVFRNLPRLPQGKWQSVGRLDLNTEGLLLFTNSGELANLLMHPRFGVEREYAVRVLGALSPEQKNTLLTGVDVDGQQAMFKSIVDGGGEGANRWYRVVITEGRNREVRKLFEAVGLAVSRLIRIRYGTVVLPRGLKRGVYVELGDADVRVIRQLAGNVPQERGDRADRGDRGGDRGDRNDRGGKRRRGGGNGGPRPSRPEAPRAEQRAQPPQHQQRPSQERQQPERQQQERPRRRDEDDDDFIPRHVNPLEQTFDRRFATSGRRGIPQGFGRGGSDPSHGNPGGDRSRGPGGERQPDPMKTSIGYIGADAFINRGNRGGRRGGGGGGGGGGNGGGRGRR